jgi:lysophospholipase L1-like esterase
MSAKIYNLVCDGNSITAGTGSSNNAENAWPPVLMSLLSGNQAQHPDKYWSQKNVAVAGHTTQQRTAAFATSVQPQFNQSYARNIVTFFEVRNDVVTNGVTLNQAITNVQAYVSQARLNGWEVMLATVPPNTTTTNSVNTIIPQFNTWLRDNPQWSDFPIVDLAADPSLDDPTDTNFYNVDQLHFNDAGYVVAAGLFQTALESTVDPIDTLLLTKRLVYSFDQLEKTNPTEWADKVAAIDTDSYKRLFQAGNFDRLRFRYAVYGYSAEELEVVYNELVTAFQA